MPNHLSQAPYPRPGSGCLRIQYSSTLSRRSPGRALVETPEFHRLTSEYHQTLHGSLRTVSSSRPRSFMAGEGGGNVVLYLCESTQRASPTDLGLCRELPLTFGLTLDHIRIFHGYR